MQNPAPHPAFLDAIVPMLIRLCAARPQNGEQAVRHGRANALFSIIKPYVTAHPAIAAHWLLALHRQAPLVRNETVASLMAEALRNHSALSPAQGMILSAAILSETRPGSRLDRIAGSAFRSAFETAMQGDRMALRVPDIALRAAAQIGDVRLDGLKTLIKSSVIQAHRKLQH
ncbi:MAG: hypothetical protein JWO78_906 [Micavibrio sp.]|nr:hypothetical protein [Micavibrio sp.]